MSYDSDEKSSALSRPIELYSFAVSGGSTYYYTSWNLPITFGGNTYTPVVLERAQIHATASDAQDFWIALPYDNPFIQAQAFGLPSHSIAVTIVRYQRNSAGSYTTWLGSVAGFATDGGSSRMVKVKVPSLLDLAMAVPIPTVFFQPTCNHQLYDSGCTVNPAGFTVSTNATAYDGAVTYTVSSVGSNSLVGGRIKVTATTEERLIVSQTFTTVTVNAPFAGTFVNPTAITMEAGCDRKIDSSCKHTFNNVVNFLGMPYIQPNRNAWNGDLIPHNLPTQT